MKKLILIVFAASLIYVAVFSTKSGLKINESIDTIKDNINNIGGGNNEQEQEQAPAATTLANLNVEIGTTAPTDTNKYWINTNMAVDSYKFESGVYNTNYSLNDNSVDLSSLGINIDYCHVSNDYLYNFANNKKYNLSNLNDVSDIASISSSVTHTLNFNTYLKSFKTFELNNKIYIALNYNNSNVTLLSYDTINNSVSNLLTLAVGNGSSCTINNLNNNIYFRIYNKLYLFNSLTDSLIESYDLSNFNSSSYSSYLTNSYYSSFIKNDMYCTIAAYKGLNFKIDYFSLDDFSFVKSENLFLSSEYDLSSANIKNIDNEIYVTSNTDNLLGKIDFDKKELVKIYTNDEFTTLRLINSNSLNLLSNSNILSGIDFEKKLDAGTLAYYSSSNKYISNLIIDEKFNLSYKAPYKIYIGDENNNAVEVHMYKYLNGVWEVL